MALHPHHLVAFYPLLLNSKDFAPFGITNGYTQDGYSRTIITPKLGARLEQGTGLDLPLNIHRLNFPQLTIGAWVQVSEAMATNQGTGPMLGEQCVSIEASGQSEATCWAKLQ
ncbi:uncharacterized protein PITG_02131 [Phytophthora infestans T30-4]|uniref:Uncharacterized protein n=1 Tax=Phytophthora infestans (strain T30-4) TaxID=403677 RepID=D0MVK0_PHYIT|nr:uncharacterized protein PITG_02131 [Phytophthora infestans T30-4]EEY63663.1 hypothetical protein PITG_02131 [Phytophthora infestans T30-4]|eukprot:XP_002907099.1 hypothetical protein PITG_02131 [Phytophthora infestans T30-4]